MTRPAHSLIVHPSGSPSGPVLSITPEQAGWEALYFEARQLAPGARFESSTGEHELGLMVLGGHGASLPGGLSDCAGPRAHGGRCTPPQTSSGSSRILAAKNCVLFPQDQ